MDFGPFGDGSNNTAPGGQSGSQQQQQQQAPSMNNTTQTQAGAGGNGPTDSGEVFMHTMEHTGVFCDICEGPIRGFRYKCMQCPDFDLCTTCERKGQHAGHIMMRISFPEQTQDAMRRFMSAPGSPPRARGFPDPLSGFPFGGFGHPHHPFDRHHGHGHGHGRRSHHRSRSEAEAAANGTGTGKDSSDDSGEEQRFPNGTGCPYYAGKKGMKKWAKCMKKMAHQHRRSAEAYAKSCGHAAASAAGMGPSAGANAEGGAPNQFDFTAAASQIQEFLNAFGIPIDVVELYDNFGNRGQPSTGEQATTGPSNVGGTGQNQGTGAENNPATETPIQPPTPVSAATATSSAQQAALAAHFGQLHLNVIRNENGSGEEQGNVATATAPPQDSLAQPVTMDLDGDSSGWTLVDNERGTSKTPTPPSVVDPIASSTTGSTEPRHVSFTMPSSGTPSLNSGSFANGVSGTEPTVVGGTAAAPPTSATPSASMYPILSPPQFHQLLSGVSQAVNSVVRNIPIVTNPSGPGSGQQQQADAPAAPEMDAKAMTTLNQLLAMGFSNHDGWLSRLVIAKRGDLEAVLNALFPTNTRSLAERLEEFQSIDNLPDF